MYIFDWKTTDVWTANGKFHWDYNILYDLYYRAGVNIERQRVASPFIGEAIESLSLYRVIDPNTWGKMVGRVNGVNFTGMYGGTHAMGWQSIKLPEGYTWREFMYFLLSTLPERARKGYLRKLSVSVNFWRTKGGCLNDETIQKLIAAKIPIIVMDNSNYKTVKKPVRMEYQDDINIAEFREIPTYKRMCICILKNDHACKYMGFSPTKEEISKRSQIMEQYDVRAVPVDKVVANDYNPNIVAPPEMKLLELSIWEDGFTMPCVCYYDKEKDMYILVDGFHRYSVLKTSKRIFQRENGLLPIVVIDKDLSNRMSSTIRHNRARGAHNIELMCHIVAELDKAGMSDQWIMKNIGMDRDELLRLKQISGLADLFANNEFSIPERESPINSKESTVV